MQKTVFYPAHIDANAKIVDFCGWQMPINYGSQVKEHEAVRTDVGMFDVSHMAINDISGTEAKDFLRYLICNDVTKLESSGYGKALYAGMLNAQGGIIDDLIVYYMPFGYRIITNAGTYTKDMAWVHQQAAKFAVNITERKDLAMVAVQGPNAIAKINQIKPHLAQQLNTLKPFMAFEDHGVLYARTGYTGENGLEIMLPLNQALEFWNELLEVGVIPCGLAARDTLRLEAGMNLYGHDMNESVSPSECNMDWVVDLKDVQRDFIGKVAYISRYEQNKVRQVGLLMRGKGILREGQKVFHAGQEAGIITSGTFSPTLKISIAMAQITVGIVNDVQVEIRGKMEPVEIVSLPFIRNGKQVFK